MQIYLLKIQKSAPPREFSRLSFLLLLFAAFEAHLDIPEFLTFDSRLFGTWHTIQITSCHSATRRNWHLCQEIQASLKGFLNSFKMLMLEEGKVEKLESMKNEYESLLTIFGCWGNQDGWGKKSKEIKSVLECSSTLLNDLVECDLGSNLHKIKRSVHMFIQVAKDHLQRFWHKNPLLWFAELELQFTAFGVTEDFSNSSVVWIVWGTIFSLHQITSKQPTNQCHSQDQKWMPSVEAGPSFFKSDCNKKTFSVPSTIQFASSWMMFDWFVMKALPEDVRHSDWQFNLFFIADKLMLPNKIQLIWHIQSKPKMVFMLGSQVETKLLKGLQNKAMWRDHKAIYKQRKLIIRQWRVRLFCLLFMKHLHINNFAT